VTATAEVGDADDKPTIAHSHCGNVHRGARREQFAKVALAYGIQISHR
jgi:hypothetical protein